MERGEYSKKYDQYQYQYNNQAQYTLMQQPKVIQYIFEQFNNIFKYLHDIYLNIAGGRAYLHVWNYQGLGGET